MKNKLQGLILSAIIIMFPGCATWTAGQSFEAGRAGAKALEATAQITCEQHDLLTQKQKQGCKDFEIAARELQHAIDTLESAWVAIAPALGIENPEAERVAKSDD